MSSVPNYYFKRGPTAPFGIVELDRFLICSSTWFAIFRCRQGRNGLFLSVKTLWPLYKRVVILTLLFIYRPSSYNDSGALARDILVQGVKKRRRQSSLTNSALVYEPKCGGKGGGGCGVSANEFFCAHGAQISFGDLTTYLTYDYCKCMWEVLIFFFVIDQ